MPGDAQSISIDATIMADQAILPVHLSYLQSSRYLARFLFDPLGAIERCYRERGPLVVITAPFRWPIKWRNPQPKLFIVVGVGPDFNREVLSDPTTWRTRSLGPGGPRNSVVREVSTGIFNMHDEKHRYYRQLFMPPLSRRSMNAQSSRMGEIAAAEVGRLPLNRTIDLWAYSRALMQAMSISLLFGDERDHGMPIAELVDDFYNHAFSWKVFLCPFRIPGTAYHGMLRDGELLKARLLEWLKRKRGNRNSNDLFSIVANNPDEKGTPLGDTATIGHIPPLMVAAFETCQNLLIWTLVLLSQHPQIARDLLDELQGRLAGAAPDLDRISDLPLLDAVINECLRILPPVPQQFRIATKDTTLCNIPVPRGTKAVLSPFLSNRDADLYPEPDRFKPERWAGLKPSSYEFASFSAGPYICPGSSFGPSIVKVLVAAILTRFRVELARNAPVDYKVTLTLTPSGKIPATLYRQDGAFSDSRIEGSIRKLVRFPN
jgi:cytochrome P450